MSQIIEKIQRSCSKILKDAYDDFAIFKSRRRQKNKYKDNRRIEICKSAPLTKEQKKSIDAFYKTYYGKTIPYVWHQNFMAHSGKFDKKYFPELLYIPEFERFMNSKIEYAKAFSNKNVLPVIAQNAGIKTPDSVLSITSGIIKDASGNILDKKQACDYLKNVGKIFIKPTIDSCSGQGCFIADFCDGKDKNTNKTSLQILDSLGKDAVMQKLIKCHESITRIYSGSVNTFRIITYRWKDEIIHMPAIMRIGQGGAFLDNAHAGGMFIAINDDGRLHKTAMTEFNNKFTSHPDSNLIFENYIIDKFPSVIKAAKNMHYAIPQLGVVNWDFTIDEDGIPLLIEANLLGGSVWLIEMAHGCGAFGDKTEEVLLWLKTMKKTPKSKRQKYEYGNNISAIPNYKSNNK